MDSDKNKKFQFSVIIPFHNQGDYLMDAVESCLRQTIGFKDNMEIILVDDASTDIGPVISEIYAEDYPNNIQYHPVKSCPITEAVKTGISLAGGKYYLILNADYFLDDHALEIAAAELSGKDGAAFVLASRENETKEPRSIHPIQQSSEKTVLDAEAFSAGMKYLNSVNEDFLLCVIRSRTGKTPLTYIYDPAAVLNVRSNFTDLDYDFSQAKFGEPYDPPYTKEQVKQLLFPKSELVMDESEELRRSDCPFLFSIIMPVYNTEKYLGEAIQSLITQSIGFKENVQVILVDDGSPDGSGALCDKYHQDYPENIDVIHQENSGPSKARFNGKKLAKGRYILFLDSDDYLTPETLKRVADYFENNPKVNIAVIPTLFFGSKTGEHPNNFRFSQERDTADLRVDWSYGQTNLPVTFFRRVLLPVITYDEGLRVSEDFHQLMKMQLLNPMIGLVSGCAYYYRKFDNEKASLSTNLYQKPDFYTPSLKNVFLDIFSLSRFMYGYIPKYIQLLVYRDLQWRLSITDISDTCLQPDEWDEFRTVCSIILSQVDDDVIYSTRVVAPYSVKSGFRRMKMNGVFDLYMGLIKKSLGASPVDIWMKEIQPELAVDIYNYLVLRYGERSLISALWRKNRGKDPAGDKKRQVTLDFSEVFELHSVDTAVRIWKNEIPEWLHMPAFDWMCEHFGKENVILSLHKQMNRDPQRLKGKRVVTPKTDRIAPHNSGIINKIKNLFSGIQTRGLKWTVAEYINNFFYYKYNILGNKMSYTSGKIILFESAPDLSDNTYCVYRWLLQQGLNDSYSFVWVVDDPERFSHIREKNVSFVKRDSHEMFVLIEESSAMVSCNRFIFSFPEKDQISLFLTHGSPLKASPDYSYMTRFNYVLSQSEWLNPYVSYENDTPLSSLYVLGIPRNDALFHPDNALSKMGFDAFRKVILWLPTYRKHRTASGAENNIKETMNMGIPVIQSREEAETLNALLRQNNILLILKPHPSQDLSNLKEIELSNFRIIYNDDLAEKGVLLYELLGASAAMITDYSSVYYDYLLTGNPIGLTMDDFDAYNSGRGFVYKDPYEILKGHQIRTAADFAAFITDVAEGNDPYKEARRQVNDLVNTYQDDRSTERVGKFLIDLLKKQREVE